MIIMKTIEIKECKDNWRVKWTEMTANMQDYSNPNYKKNYIMGGVGGGIQSKQTSN